MSSQSCREYISFKLKRFLKSFTLKVHVLVRKYPNVKIEINTHIFSKKQFIKKPTSSLSEGTLDKKSSSSLLGIALGARNFFVNLLMPRIEKETRV